MQDLCQGNRIKRGVRGEFPGPEDRKSRKGPPFFGFIFFLRNPRRDPSGLFLPIVAERGLIRKEILNTVDRRHKNE
jgi:hypothetical protein